ncbi:D-glycero-alpha-D-manno-heptose-1,7-bisphosphate 7-phosphatase [Desertibaculum subflavum]|uniref:D-glycero-alpha-D-manno-heptose-1,7-bisphosphate 7-phosphatase n=1 Tax=Desertibaculum subflavum TaxID=2268458 RepID=UPI0013C52BBB
MQSTIGRSRPAVFLDRDGVINSNVHYADSGLWEAPRRVADLALRPEVPAAARALCEAGFALFVVTNQPNAARRKASMADLRAVQTAAMAGLVAGGAALTEDFVCFHHPEGVVPELSIRCVCRKPSPFFLHEAARRHAVDLKASWMVGDRDTDIECGQAAGTRTIQIAPDHPGALHGAARPDFHAADLAEAAAIILAAARPGASNG